MVQRGGAEACLAGLTWSRAGVALGCALLPALIFYEMKSQFSTAQARSTQLLRPVTVQALSLGFRIGGRSTGAMQLAGAHCLLINIPKMDDIPEAVPLAGAGRARVLLGSDESFSDCSQD